ncbi:MAG: pyruvate dehydrogenase E2 component (dihydrolipoamide acetyltransferase) [Psychromonas sp.]|jgi:pyruvate dehydrogenase E2 component (dihydrolipoamide acetyltransferase)|uniref:dihydrolipoamide acetyltransferase family protein n=1 Tax=Psychromonas sp. TaxID=1884585 RepID=UPI0039E394E1
MSNNEHDLKMPSFGSDMKKGTLTQWLVKEGDSIKRGDVVAVIETHKGAIDLDIFEDALIISLLVKEGDKIAVGEPIARLRTSNIRPHTANVTNITSNKTSTATIEDSAATANTNLRPAFKQPDNPATPKRFVVATPAARSFAKQQQLTLNALFPNKMTKIVTLAMIEQVIKQQQLSQQMAENTAQPADKKATLNRAPAPPDKGFNKEAMRQAISATVTRSKQQIPHYYLRQRLDITNLEEYLLQVNAELPVEQRLLIAAPLLCAIARTLMDNQQLNGEYKEDRFVASDTVHLANAINLRSGGLIMPVIRAAQTLSPSQMMEVLKQQVTHARNGSLLFSELSGGSFTVTSLGERGAEQMFAVIFPPQVAILALGSPHQEVMAVADAVKIRSVIEASLAADHRVSDGRIGARLLYQLNQLLQKPEALWTV